MRCMKARHFGRHRCSLSGTIASSSRFLLSQNRRSRRADRQLASVTLDLTGTLHASVQLWPTTEGTTDQQEANALPGVLPLSCTEHDPRLASAHTAASSSQAPSWRTSDHSRQTRPYKGVTYLCPHCRAVLSVSLDQTEEEEITEDDIPL
jgi:hypothetical protein